MATVGIARLKSPRSSMDLTSSTRSVFPLLWPATATGAGRPVLPGTTGTGSAACPRSLASRALVTVVMHTRGQMSLSERKRRLPDG
ncbi:hypothetical protein GCM10007147_34770 [Nocardiopsis kunsanensis]|uniref:Uncharacterized protein n=1 Tax=Nocardiopsis kunsanensis TaxID=141693 RepID=A0A918XHF0_9ACTN|nr:hypothetical protein GCM10007147_34770 [Nocardiopsis kunsanensis]